MRETINPPVGQTFRMIRWENNLHEVESILADGTRQKIGGEGDHWHHHVEMELTLFTHGQGTRFVGDHIGEFRGGDLVLLGSNLPHYWYTRDRSHGISLQWHFPVSHPIWTFPELTAVKNCLSVSRRGIRLKGKTAQRMSEIMEEMVHLKAGARLARLIDLLVILSEIPPRHRELLSSRQYDPVMTGAKYQNAISDAVKYLIDHFREEIRVGDLLRVTGMSRPTFARQFKEYAGRSMSEFVNRLRIQAACKELEDTHKTIIEVAFNSGFNEVSFFNRLFRREIGTSPREYRARIRKL